MTSALNLSFRAQREISSTSSRGTATALNHEVFMSLRSSTEYEIAGTPPQVLSLTRHAGEAGIQGREGMDTGFRRYDGTFVPSRRPDHTCTGIFEGVAMRVRSPTKGENSGVYSPPRFVIPAHAESRFVLSLISLDTRFRGYDGARQSSGSADHLRTRILDGEILDSLSASLPPKVRRFGSCLGQKFPNCESVLLSKNGNCATVTVSTAVICHDRKRNSGRKGGSLWLQKQTNLVSSSALI